MTTYKEKHHYYNARFCDLSFIAFHKSVGTNDVSQRDMKLALNIFAEMADDREIVLSDEAYAYIRQLSSLPKIGVDINELLLTVTIDFVLKDMRIVSSQFAEFREPDSLSDIANALLVK